MSKKTHLLLADDDKDDRLLFEKALYKIQFPTKLSAVENGEALSAFLNKKTAQLPDVIFLDLNMPRKNGLECLLEIKKDKRLEHIPVIIYSTSLHEEIADLLYQNQAHYYLKKRDFFELPLAISSILSLLSKSPERPPRHFFVLKRSFANNELSG